MGSRRRNIGRGGRGDDSKKTPEEIAEERIEAARQSEARDLDLKSLGLTELPASIGHLTQLQTLNIHDNRLMILPDAVGQLSEIQLLDIGFNQLTVLPEALCRLSKLRHLIVYHNRVAVPPDFIGQLTQLYALWLDNNELTSLPKTLGQLTRLNLLDISKNRLTALPETLGQLTQLTELRTSGNQLTVLPEYLRRLPNLKVLHLHDNPALGLPPELLGPTWEDVVQGKGAPASPKSILDYYFSKRISRPLNEAKMILVGRGGVGKTSLVNRLAHGGYDSEEKKTDGIAITQWPVHVGTDQVRLNIWDFGGQEIMHATHQFFLTKRSLYLLVLNAREGEQDANVEYWLQLIESFGADSPVLVVINKIKDHAFDLNRRGLQAKFPAIRGFIQTDCDAEIGLEELRQAILRETDRLEHLRDPFPASWFTVKDRLADLPRTEKQNFIPFARYQQLCADNGVQEPTSQETLVGFLHDLGIVVNFRDDPRLAETHVLNPEWVTNGIYKILNAETLAHKQGELRLEELPAVLAATEYPKAMHLYLLDLMRKFELCYEFYESAGHYLVPELLGKEEPDLKELAVADALRFEYRYNIVPEGLLPRFIVRSRALNKDLPRWRTGVVLAWDGNRAVVKADVQGKRVSIAITGPPAGRRRLLAVIRADMEDIHHSIAKLQAAEQVPVPGHPGLVVEYETLRVLEAEGETEIKLVHSGKIVKSKVAELLNGVEEAPARVRDPMREAAGKEAARVVLSYSHKDEELRDQLGTHLKLFQRQGLISTWSDRKIMPGDKWAGVIDDHL
jgi:internalin A